MTRGALIANFSDKVKIKNAEALLRTSAFLVAGVGFEPTTSRLCLPLQLSLLSAFAEIRGLDYAFTHRAMNKTVRVSAV